MSANDWIKVRTVLPSDGRLRIVSRKCHASTVTVFGALVTVWCLADSHADENGVLIGYTEADIDALAEMPGFCSALPADWIDLSGEYVKLPSYQEHNGTTGKSRALANKRQAKCRGVTEESRSKRDTSVTRIEKKREEKKEVQSEVLPAWLPDKAWADFVAHRKAIGKAMTQLAKERMLARLASLRDAGHDVLALMDTAILKGWSDVYEPKPAGQFNSPSVPTPYVPGGGRRELGSKR